MASAHHDPLRLLPGTPTRRKEICHHGQSDLAEVVPIRSSSDSQDIRTGGMMRRIAQAFAPLRVQLTTGVQPPRPPSSATPRSRVLTLVASPDDAA